MSDELVAERETVIRRDPTAAAHYIVAVEGEADTLRQQLEGAVQERDAFARALRLAVASPELREAYIKQAKDSLAREGGR